MAVMAKMGSSTKVLKVRSTEIDPETLKFSVWVDGGLEEWPLQWIKNAIEAGAKVLFPDGFTGFEAPPVAKKKGK